MAGIGERGSARHVVVPYGSDNASVRARAIHWIERLQGVGRLAPGSVAVHGPPWPERHVPAGTSVLLLRNVGRFTRGGREHRLFRNAELAVYDLDDGLPWDDGRLPGLGRWWKRPFRRSRVAGRAARTADRMIVGNQVLADWASVRCPDVRIVPTCVEPNDYARRTAWELDEAPTIGWIGSPATEPYLADVAPALRDVHERTGARLHIISGGDAPHPYLASFTTISKWTPASSRLIATFDIGIMPLRNGVYERAKCGYKLLQYAASGVPAVASPVGVNASILDAMDGLAATSLDEWSDALVQLLSEPSRRREARAAAGAAVAQTYSYASWEDVWFEAVGW